MAEGDFAAEDAIAQICREGGARVSSNVMLRDLDITPSHRSDTRRSEIFPGGFDVVRRVASWPLTPLLSRQCADGAHRRKADTTGGQALRHKVRTHPRVALRERSRAAGSDRQRGGPRKPRISSAWQAESFRLCWVGGSPGTGDQVPSVKTELADTRQV